MSPKKMSKSKAKKPARAKPVKRATPKAPAGVNAKQQFLDSFIKEHGTTMKLLRALPQGQGDFRPHERSQTARALANTFVLEQMMITRALKGEPVFGGGGGMPKPPEDLNAIIDQFDREFNDLVALVKKTPDAKLAARDAKFPTGPGQMGDWTRLAFAWMMLSDQIHHRGQLSVYIRMAGGKVPSIYGPSADEPWR